MLISEEYRGLNSKLHDVMPSWGAGAGAPWMGPYMTFKFRSCLDYGCGKGKLTVACEDFRRYDPAIPEFSADPLPADLVLCLTVLEHVEPECIDDVLGHLEVLTKRRIIIKVTTVDSNLRLADRTSVHRTIRPSQWWLRKCIDHWDCLRAEKTTSGFRFVGGY